MDSRCGICRKGEAFVNEINTSRALGTPVSRVAQMFGVAPRTLWRHFAHSGQLPPPGARDIVVREPSSNLSVYVQTTADLSPVTYSGRVEALWARLWRLMCASDAVGDVAGMRVACRDLVRMLPAVASCEPTADELREMPTEKKVEWLRKMLKDLEQRAA